MHLLTKDTHRNNTDTHRRPLKGRWTELHNFPVTPPLSISPTPAEATQKTTVASFKC